MTCEQLHAHLSDPSRDPYKPDKRMPEMGDHIAKCKKCFRWLIDSVPQALKNFENDQHEQESMIDFVKRNGH